MRSFSKFFYLFPTDDGRGRGGTVRGELQHSMTGDESFFGTPEITWTCNYSSHYFTRLVCDFIKGSSFVSVNPSVCFLNRPYRTSWDLMVFI